MLPLALIASMGCDEADLEEEDPRGPPPEPPSYRTWEKVELPDTYCGDGSQYKFFVNWSESSDNLAIFLEPGGACWDWESCSGQEGIKGAANPNGIPDDHMVLWGIHTPLIQRESATPFADWNLVFLPYCTGDVHTGNNTVDYQASVEGEEGLTYIHNGHANMMAVIDWLDWRFPEIPDMFVGGCSAGGAGSQVNYYFLRSGLNVERGYMLNDSGPIFPDSDHSAPLHAKIRESWDVDPVIDQLEDAERIKADFGSINEVIAERWPEDRLGIAYFMRDKNYSLYSYERFWNLDPDDPEDEATIFQYWEEDTQKLMSQYDRHDNMGYFLPHQRILNDSHCTIIFGYGGGELGGQNVGNYVDTLIEGEGPVPSMSDFDGDGEPD